MFGNQLKNSIVTIYCDNEAVCNIINNMSCKTKILAHFLRLLVLKVIEFNIDIRAKHIPGLSNDLCDRISRFQVDQELLIKYKMNTKPTPIPEHLMPSNFTLPPKKML